MTVPAAEPLFERQSAPAPEPEPEPVAAAPEPEPEPEAAAPVDTAADDDWDMPELTPPDAPSGVAADEPLELELEADDGMSGGGDELLLDADRLAEEDEPVASGGAIPGRRRGLVSSSDDTAEAGSYGAGDDAGADAPAAGGAEPAAAPQPRAPRVGGGATLFERMANLSRGGNRPADDEDEDDDGPAISIPRFLGRQNNQ